MHFAFGGNSKCMLLLVAFTVLFAMYVVHVPSLTCIFLLNFFSMSLFLPTEVSYNTNKEC